MMRILHSLGFGLLLFFLPLADASQDIWVVSTPSGLNFRDTEQRKILALANGSSVEATGRKSKSGRWGEFRLPDGRLAWAFLKYIKLKGPADTADADPFEPNEKTDAGVSDCRSGKCRSKRPADERQRIEEEAAAAVPEKLPRKPDAKVSRKSPVHPGGDLKIGKGGYARPVDAPPGRRGFGLQRDPWGGYARHHNGQDFPAAHGSKVKASKEGVVVSHYNQCGAGSGRSCGGGMTGHGYGNAVMIRHPDGNYTMYAHLSAGCAVHVQPGTKVYQGQQIGCVGATGNATGPHLHFEIRVGRSDKNAAVDPMRFLK